MKRTILLICFLSEFFSTIALSQDTLRKTSADNLLNLSLEEFLNIVITPSKSTQSISDVTQKIDIISSKEIKSNVSGNRNICETISAVPGISVTVLSRNDVNWGTYGGIGPKYSTYMLQGLPIDAFMDPMSLDLNAIDHIEVQRGPASIIYPNYLSQDFAGSQSPLAGTVNLILKDKIDHKQTSFQTSVGSYNTLNGQLYHQNIYNNVNYFFGFDSELSDYTNYGTSGSWLDMRKNPEYRKNKMYAGLTLFMDKDEKQKLTLYCQETWHSGDAGRAYRGFDNKYGTVNVGYNIAFNDRVSLQSHIGLRSYIRTWQESVFGNVDTLKSNNGVNQIIVPFDISLSLSHGRSSSLSIGVDYQDANYSTWIDPLAGYKIFGNISSAIQKGVYVQEEWRPAKGLTLRGGLRYTDINNQIVLENSGSPAEDKLSWNKILWSGGIKYSISNNISAYLNSGSSFSTPDLKSIGGTILLSDLGIPGHDGQLPNQNLKPEKGLGTDVGIDFSYQSNFKIGIRGFYTILHDGIVDNIVSLNPSQTQSINTQSTATGGEVEIKQLVNSLFSWYLNFTYMSSNIKDKLNADQNDVDIPFSPNLIANIGGKLNLKSGFTFSPSVNYNAGFYDGISRTRRTKNVSGIVLNAWLSQQIFKNETYMLECYAQLYNLTNNDFNMPWQFKNPGFSGMIGIKLTF